MKRTLLVSIITSCLFFCLSYVPVYGHQQSTPGGSIFVTGHDPVWHAHFGGNQAGARNLALTAIAFGRNGSSLPFLFVESIHVRVPSGNAHEAPFLTSALGFSASDFVVADINVLSSFSDFRAALDGFSAIVVASDHGGMLSAAELQFLNDHASDIIDYINAGGGLVAFAQSNGTGMIGSTPRFGFLPFLVSSVDFHVPETGNTVTEFGSELGLSNSDVNGNFSHNFFIETGGMLPVDLLNGDPSRPLTLAFRGPVSPGGVDDTPPLCEQLTLIRDSGGQIAGVSVEVSDPESGIASILFERLLNATGQINGAGSFVQGQTESFTPPETDMLTVSGLKSDMGQRSVFQILVTNGVGLTTRCDPVYATLTAEVPEAYALEQNYPNPFNPLTMIRFNLAEASMVTLKVYDMTGRPVRTLISENMAAGVYAVEWDGRNDMGQAVTSSVYLYQIVAGSFTSSRSMILMK